MLHRPRIDEEAVDIHDVDDVCWGGILWAKRNINQQYKEADYAVFIGYQDMVATDVEWWYENLGAAPSPLVSERGSWSI